MVQVGWDLRNRVVLVRSVAMNHSDMLVQAVQGIVDSLVVPVALVVQHKTAVVVVPVALGVLEMLAGLVVADIDKGVAVDDWVGWIG